MYNKLYYSFTLLLDTLDSMPSSIEDDRENLLVPGQFRQSKVRWYILLLTGFLGMVQSLIWMGWGTVSQEIIKI